MIDQKEEFLLKAYNLGIIKFGNFILKSGISSPFYIDLRPLASSPQLLKILSNFLLKLEINSDFNLICGVPYAALPIATVMSILSNIPLIIKRKENKGYGTKRILEGVFYNNQTCLLVEDVITTGKSLIETISVIENEGLIVKNIVVVLDRQQRGIIELENKGYKVKTLFTIHEVINILFKNKILPLYQKIEIENFLKITINKFKTKRLSYEDKIKINQHPIAQKLLNLTKKKKSNLIFSGDINSSKKLLNLLEEIGEHIVILKTHIDIIQDFSFDLIKKIKFLAKEKEFLVMEDRKFSDIGKIQEEQFKNGIYKISTWADMITSHVISGEKSISVFDSCGIVAIFEMSSIGTLTDSYYKYEALKIAKKTPNIFAAIGQSNIPKNLLLMTPGINLDCKFDNKGQIYNTPNKVFREYHSDFIIVGRDIYENPNPKQKAAYYQKIGWKNYLNSL